ncbi:nuclear transport factor 2 family protein [Psychrobacter vallis]|uniref:nuclear transport factor 2 family protein n=1 Tax=Psychrobacter vallis TaxID=248451 RepID=UPI00191A755F|nr:nuclear transport factor 2 family protein [Psychrobacter vallis]
MQTKSNIQTLDQFVAHVFTGEYEQAMQLCDKNVEFVVFRKESDSQIPIYGTHIGQAAGTIFFKNLAQMFEFGTFAMEDSIASDNYIVRFGELAHTVKRTGDVFNSLWTMIVRFDEAGKICLYRMHEDTAALEAAMQIAR